MEQKVKELALLGKSPQEIAKILGIPLAQMNQYHKALQAAFLLRAEFVPESEPEVKAVVEEKPKTRGRKPPTPAQLEKAKARKRKRDNEYQVLRRQRMKKDPALYEEYLKKRRALQKAYRQKIKENNPEKYAEIQAKKRAYAKGYYERNSERLKANNHRWYLKNKQHPVNDLEKWEDRLAREREWRLKYLAKHPELKMDLDDPRLEEIRKTIELEQMQKKES